MLFLLLAISLDTLSPPSLIAPPPQQRDTMWMTTHDPLRERVPYDPKAWVRATPPAILPKKKKE